MNGAIAHKFVLLDLQLAYELDEQGRAALARIVVCKRVIDYVGTVGEKLILFVWVEQVLKVAFMGHRVIYVRQSFLWTSLTSLGRVVGLSHLARQIRKLILGSFLVMLAANDPCATIVLFKPDVALEVITIDQDSRATSLERITCVICVRYAIVNHPHFHLNMKSVTRPIRHIVLEFILVEHDSRVVSVTEIRVFYVYHTSCRPDIILKRVA